MRLSAFLFDELWREGVRQIFGIPGDFVLNLYNALEDDGRFRLVRLSHEPSVGFAADGAARITGGLGVCCITYGAGGLNMINPVACAYAEESPLVVLSGGPSRAEKAAAILVHHEVKSFESQLRVYQEVTEYAAIVDDPRTAASHIRKAIEVATKMKRPVYLEIPRDMVQADIDVPDVVDLVPMPVDAAAVDEAAQEILARLAKATRPVIIVGVEVHRFRLQERVTAFAERLNVPVASSFLGRGVFPTRHPNFVGTYLGVVSPPHLRAILETSDCVLLLGELVSDTGLGVSAGCLSDTNLLIATARDVYVGHHRYQNTPLELVVSALLASPSLPRKSMPTHVPTDQLSPEVMEVPQDSESIKVRHLVFVLNEFLAAHSNTPVVVDTGDALFAAVDIRANEIVGPAYYGTMGFAVPAALGVEIAGGRRPIVLVGDGAFQMTGAEISHAPVQHCRPIVIVLNNARWEMLQAFFPNAGYNGTVPWPFARLAELWGGRGFDARTPGEFRRALSDAWQSDRFSLIDVSLQQGDLSPILRGFVQAFKAKLAKSG
jgi:indolepyruvate decarboxylase